MHEQINDKITKSIFQKSPVNACATAVAFDSSEKTTMLISFCNWFSIVFINGNNLCFPLMKTTGIKLVLHCCIKCDYPAFL